MKAEAVAEESWWVMPYDSKEAAKRTVEQSWQAGEQTIALGVDGISMGATIPAGSTIHVHFSRNPALLRNRLIYFRRGRRRIVHRLMLRVGPVIIEKGDAIYGIGFCTAGQVLGTVEKIERPRASG